MNQQNPTRTTQEVLEEFIRWDCLHSHCNIEKTESMVADFRRRFAGQYDHPPNPVMLAMIEAEKLETLAFIRHMEQINESS